MVSSSGFDPDNGCSTQPAPAKIWQQRISLLVVLLDRGSHNPQTNWFSVCHTGAKHARKRMSDKSNVTFWEVMSAVRPLNTEKNFYSYVEHTSSVSCAKKLNNRGFESLPDRWSGGQEDKVGRKFLYIGGVQRSG